MAKYIIRVTGFVSDPYKSRTLGDKYDFTDEVDLARVFESSDRAGRYCLGTLGLPIREPNGKESTCQIVEIE